MAENPVFRVENIEFAYDSEPTLIVDELDFQANRIHVLLGTKRVWKNDPDETSEPAASR